MPCHIEFLRYLESSFLNGHTSLIFLVDNSDNVALSTRLMLMIIGILPNGFPLQHH
jgi:hypothetical protein